MSDARWAPVVYGRTRRVDRWWRAMPAGLDADFAHAVVRAVAAGGRALEEGPRFVLAQHRNARIVGGVCLSRELSPTMNSDEINRPLYSFVGWAAVEQESLPNVPSISNLARGFVEWAGPVYDCWMGLDWDLHESQVSGPHISERLPAPWGALETPPPPITERPPGCQSVAWPQEQAAVPWDLLRTTSRPGLVVSGWNRLADAQVSVGTWIVCSEVTERRVLDASAPERRPGRSRARDDFEQPSDRRPLQARWRGPAAGAEASEEGRHYADVRADIDADGAASRSESRDLRMRRDAWRMAGQKPPTVGDGDAITPDGLASSEPRRSVRVILPSPRRLLAALADAFLEPEPPSGPPEGDGCGGPENGVSEPTAPREGDDAAPPDAWPDHARDGWDG